MNWKTVLNKDPTGWLLEKNNPSVRYYTLTEIFDKSENNQQVKITKNEIMKKGPVQKILDKQSKEGYWESPERAYTAKYKGTVWQIIILAELGASKEDERIQRACEFILKNLQDLKSGGFSIWHSSKTGGGRYNGVIPCLTGNMIWSLIKLGYLDDIRVQNGIKWITTYQRFDDGINQRPKGWPYDKATSCFSTHSCHMGVVKSLKALSEIPIEKRSKDVSTTIKVAIEYLLKHHIHKKSHNLNKVSKPSWLRFGFPLMYQTDVLEILGILTKLDCRDIRMQEAIDLVVSKQDKEGRWKLESTFNGRFQTNIEQKGNQSKWITLRALKVLKRIYS
jgi:hypothetical protein